MDGKIYYKSGDIGELIKDGEVTRLRIIDRASSFFKLSQGEWISPSKIENILEECPWVKQVLILGKSSYPYTVAIVVPSHLTKDYCKNNNISISESSNKVLQEIRFWSIHCHLRPIEIPQAIYIETEFEWTPENSLLTSTLKKRRANLTNHYKNIRDELYSNPIQKDIPREENNQLSKEFLQILENVLPQNFNFDPTSTFTEIGGDSLSAARLLNILKEKNLTITLQSLFEYPLSHISRLVDIVYNNGDVSSLLVSSDPSIDWKKEFELNFDHIKKYEPSQSQRHIFLTGCTGFLGPILVDEILKQYPENIHVYCLIRGENKQIAFERLKQDMEKAYVWSDKYIDRIKILCGELSLPHFSLSDEEYSDVLNNISDIYHSGASVNMVLPYSVLKKKLMLMEQ